MPIKKDEKKLRELIERALQAEDIQNCMNKCNLDTNEIIEKVLYRSQEIWKEGGNIKTELDKLEKEKPIGKFASKQKKKQFDDREEEYQIRFDKIVLENGILPLLREIIMKKLGQSYDFKLLKFKLTGLSEIFNSAHEIETSAKKRLQFMLKNMPGGSIGIAGPRGVGKSTLIRSVCMSSSFKLPGKEIFSVMTSAPVEYGARDFMLHIFAMVCNKILTEFDPENQGVLGHKLHDMRSPFIENLLTLFRKVRLLSIVLGIVFLIASVFLAGIDERNLILGPLFKKSNISDQSQLTPTEQKIPNEIKSSEIKDQSAKTAKQSIGSLIIGLKHHSARMSIWAIILLIFGISLSVFLYLIPSEKERLKNSPYNSLIEQAKEAIKEIKFQQTYTTGWIGSLRFPLGTSSTIEEAVSLAKKQLSLPEIVDALLNFLGKISKDFRIIIGIDELDKLESDEKAILFINEVKAIFGQEDCFYLISVSESAMSNFERRGLPFRDSFDSAFDDVLNVDYMSLEEIKLLLWRRVVGTPIPFICLCYCMSGGLPREVIRVYRDILELVDDNSDENSLDKLTETLLKSEIIAKIRATIILSKKLNLVNAVTTFLKYLLELEMTVSSINEFRSKCLELIPILLKGQDDNLVEKKPRSEIIKLNSLGQDLVAYLYYTLTLLDFFNDKLNEVILESAIEEGFIDKLAKAKQYQMINSSISIILINEFRKKFEFDLLC